MKAKLPLPREKKLTVVFRVEPGCLGPEGQKHAEEFCAFAQQACEPIDADFVHWEIVPRYDKSKPEHEYNINSRYLSHDKAEQYLALFGKSLDEFEGHFHDRVTQLIEEFHGRYS